MTEKTFRIVMAAVLATLCVFLFISIQQQSKLEDQLERATVQNVQLTKDVAAAKIDGFRAGLITCSNEDIAYFNAVADEYAGTSVGDVFRGMAQNWAYDGGRIDELVESYMNGDSH